MKHLSAVALFLLWAVACAFPAFAVEQSDIAVIEDTDGSINASVSMPNAYLSKVTCPFYQTHPDIYDGVFVFTTYPLNFLTNVQQGWPVKQGQLGIGRDDMWNQTQAFCSNTGRLAQAVKMGDLAILPDDPDALYTGIPFYPLSGIELMGHEFGHHWLASVRFDKNDGTGRHCILRGMETNPPNEGECDGLSDNDFNQHWSYYFNSRSIMYGSFIDDNGDGTFTTYYVDPKFSELDQYLMGLRLSGEVSPMFLVKTEDNISGSASIPIAARKTINGTRMDFTIEDVIRVEGPRVPQLDECHWKAAMILVTPAGQPPTDVQLAKMVTYANRWEQWYAWATDDRGSMDLTIDGSGAGTQGCPAVASDGDYDWPDNVDSDKTDTESVAEEELPQQCTVGERRCNGDRIVQCNDQHLWALVDDCTYSGKVCANAECVDAPDGDDDVIDTVDDSDTTDKPDTTDIPEGAVCSPGLTRCSGTKIEKCTANGMQWETYTDCAPRACSAGLCVDGGDGEEDGTPAKGSSGSGCAAGGAAWAAITLLALAASRRRRA